MKYAYAVYNWKQGGCEKQYKTALKEFGLVMTSDPILKDTDTYGFFITKNKPSKKQLTSMLVKEWGKEVLEYYSP